MNTVSLFYKGETVYYIILSTIQHCVFYPYGALWYIKASIVGAIMIALGFKLLSGNANQKTIKILVVSFVFYIIAELCNNYYFVIKGTGIAKIADLYMHYCLSSRNGVFVGCFMLSVGVFCYSLFQKIKKGQITYLVSLLIIALYAFELIMISKVESVQDDGALYFSHILICPLLLYALLQVNNINLSEKLSIRLRNLSTGIYLLHRPVLIIVSHVSDNMLIRFALTVSLSLIICLVTYRSRHETIATLLK